MVANKNSNNKWQRVVIGTRVSVYWPADEAWYRGTVSEDSGGSVFTIYYDDGDVDTIDLASEKFKILANKTNNVSNDLPLSPLTENATQQHQQKQEEDVQYNNQSNSNHGSSPSSKPSSNKNPVQNFQSQVNNFSKQAKNITYSITSLQRTFKNASYNMQKVMNLFSACGAGAS